MSRTKERFGDAWSINQRLDLLREHKIGSIARWVKTWVATIFDPARIAVQIIVGQSLFLSFFPLSEQILAIWLPELCASHLNFEFYICSEHVSEVISTVHENATTQRARERICRAKTYSYTLMKVGKLLFAWYAECECFEAFSSDILKLSSKIDDTSF